MGKNGQNNSNDNNGSNTLSKKEKRKQKQKVSDGSSPLISLESSGSSRDSSPKRDSTPSKKPRTFTANNMNED